MYKIIKELESLKTAYDTSINLTDGLPFKQKDLIKQIEFYSNSKYLGGQKDELGRDKPFYNILNAMCDVENAAKDIDTKDITATSDDGNHFTEAFIMSKDIYQWMKEADFAKTLNDIRDTHSRYGSVLVKKCMEEDEDGVKTLEIELPAWKNVITDQVEIENQPIVEVHYMTASELLSKTEWKNVDEVAEKLMKEGSTKRIPVFEVRGMFPVSYFKELEGKKPTKKDEKTFTYQLYYIAGQYSPQQSQTTISNQSITLGSIPLYWENDTEKVYKYLARKPKAGRAFGVGVLEEGTEAQVWTNDAILKQRDAMEHTTKVIGQTASKKLRGRNLLTEVDNGAILEHEDGKPITPLNMLPSGGLNQYQNLLNQWYQQFERATSAYSAQRGEEPQSGTPFRLQALVLQQSNSVFSNLQEDLGIFITEIFEDWIMPFLAKKLNTEHILAHDFSPEELKELDKNFATFHANEMAKEMILSGEIVSAEDYAQFMETATTHIGQTKSTRFLQIPKDYYKGFKAKITVNVTGEQRNKAAVMESLLNIMTVYVKNPAIAQDPVLMQLFMKIVELSGAGISPVQIMGAIEDQKVKMEEQQAQQQMMAQQPGGTPNPMSLAANPNPNEVPTGTIPR